MPSTETHHGKCSSNSNQRGLRRRGMRLWVVAREVAVVVAAATAPQSLPRVWLKCRSFTCYWAYAATLDLQMGTFTALRWSDQHGWQAVDLVRLDFHQCLCLSSALHILSPTPPSNHHLELCTVIDATSRACAYSLLLRTWATRDSRVGLGESATAPR